MERDVAGRVRAVDDDEQAGLPRPAADLGDREGQRRWAGDVAQEDEARAFADAAPEGLDDGLGALDRQPDRLADVPGASLCAQESPGAIQGAVLVICRQHLVARAEGQAARQDRKSTRLNSSHGYISY